MEGQTPFTLPEGQTPFTLPEGQNPLFYKIRHPAPAHADQVLRGQFCLKPYFAGADKDMIQTGGGLVDIFTRKNQNSKSLTRGVRIELGEDNAVSVSLTIIVDYGGEPAPFPICNE